MKMESKRMFPILFTAALVAWGAGSVSAAGPGTLKFDESSFEVLEEAGIVMITVERSQGEDGAVSVGYATSDGTAAAGADYAAASGTLSWGNNDGSNRTFTIPILDDGVNEGSETIRLALSGATGGATIDAVRGTSLVVILASDGGGGGNPDDNGGGNDDGPGDDHGGDDDGDGRVGVFKFDQRDFFAVEAAGVAVISVERSHGENGAASVDYATSDGTATAGSDYTPASGTLSWAPGEESSKVFSVAVMDDGVEEGSETVVLTLSNPTGGAGLDDTRATAMLTLLDDGQGNGAAAGDDDRPGTLKFGSATFQAIEGAVTATIVVERSHGERGTVSVEYRATDGSATDGLDYEATSGVLTWGPRNGADQAFTITLFDDKLAEGNETIQLALAQPTGGATIDPARGTASLVLLDDDGATVPCVPSGSTLCLSGGRFSVEVDWRSPQGDVGSGGMQRVSDRSGLVWFFDQSNVEMLVKVLDACQPFGSYWVFFAATTNVDFTMTVTDTETGIVKQYTNPMGQAALPVQDTLTFEGCN